METPRFKIRQAFSRFLFSHCARYVKSGYDTFCKNICGRCGRISSSKPNVTTPPKLAVVSFARLEPRWEELLLHILPYSSLLLKIRRIRFSNCRTGVNFSPHNPSLRIVATVLPGGDMLFLSESSHKKQALEPREEIVPTSELRR